MTMHEFGWPTEPLGELCEVVMGRTPSRSEPSFWGEGHPWLSISDMGDTRDLVVSRETITDAGAAEFNGRIVDPGTLLMSFKLSIGKLGFARVPLYTNEAIAALPVKNAERVLPEYLYYALQVIDLLAETDKAAKGKTLNKAKIKRLPIPLPTLEEQHRIVDVLDRADALRAKRQRAQETLDDLLRSAFMELVGDPLENPKGWTTQKLVDTIPKDRPVTYGILKPGPDLEGGVPYVRVVDIADDTVLVDQLSRTSEKIAHQYRRSTLMPGDVLLSIRGHVGRLGLVPEGLEGANITQDTARLAPSDAVIAEYLIGCLRTLSIQREMARYVKGASVKGINLGDVKKLVIPVPPLDVQRQYASVWRQCQDLRRKHDARAQKVDDVYHSLAQRAFSGELFAADAATA